MTECLNELGQPVGALVPSWQPASLPTDRVMTGRYCRVERLDPKLHAEDLFAANQVDSRGANWTYLSYGPFSDFPSYRAWLDVVAVQSDPTFFAVVDVTTQRAVGVATYMRIDPESGSIEVGHINFSPLLQRNRMGTEAMYLMMQTAFDELGYRRYEWKCDSLNSASRGAALRLGFSYEGTFRQSGVVKGRNRDTAWFSVIDDEWPRIKQAFQTWLDPANFDADGAQIASLTARQQSEA